MLVLYIYLFDTFYFSFVIDFGVPTKEHIKTLVVYRLDTHTHTLSQMI